MCTAAGGSCGNAACGAEAKASAQDCPGEVCCLNWDAGTQSSSDAGGG
jgi:hypothetical protein